MSALTVIIPTLNRPQLVLNLVYKLQMQSLDSSYYRILIIDNGSNINSFDKMKQGISELCNVELHQTKEPGLHVARHLGVDLAQTENLIFCDDDISPNRDWLSSIVETFTDKNVGMIAGDVIPSFAQEPEPWLSYLWHHGWTNNAYIKAIPPLSVVRFQNEYFNSSDIANYVWGCSFPIRKNIIQECGGFNPDGFKKSLQLFRGDGETKVTNFIKKNGYKVEYVPDASVHHLISEERMCVDYFYKRGFAQGISKSYSLLRSSANITLVKEYIKVLAISLKFASRIPGKKEFLLGQKNGFLYHQKNYLMSEELRSWVNKDDYI